MANNNIYKKILSLPENVQDYFFSKEVEEKILSLKRKYKIKDDLDTIVYQVALKEINLNDLQTAVKNKYRLSDNFSINLAKDLENKIISQIVDKLGLQPAKEKQNKIIKKSEPKKSFGSLIQDLEKEFSIKKDQEARLKELLYSWAREIRKDYELIDSLTRAFSSGGLGLKKKQAEDLVHVLKKNVEKEAFKKWLETKYTKDNPKDLEDIDIDKGMGKANVKNLAQVIKERDKILDKYKELAPPPPVVKEQKKRVSPQKLAEIINKYEKELVTQQKERISPRVLAKAVDDLEKDLPEIKKEKQKGKEKLDKIFESAKAEVPEIKPLEGELSPEEQLKGLEYIPYQQAEKSHKKKEKNKQSFLSKLFGKEKEPPLIQSEEKSFAKKLEEISKRDESLRPRVEEVKALPKLFGPKDELAKLNLSTFRKLSNDPNRAIEKIIEKLELLEQDSLQDRAEGVAALKRSPLYLKYSEILQKSINDRQSQQAVIAQLQKIGEETLSQDEFNAIIKLNQAIKY